MAELSAYEKEREANIARNRALLEQLDLKDASTSLGVPSKPAPKPKAKPIQPAKKLKREHIDRVPRRQSARLQKEVIDPNETPAQRRRRETEAAKRKREEEEDRIAAEEQAMLAKRPRTHDLDLVVLTDVGELDDNDMNALRGTFQAVTNTAIPRRVGSVRDWVFERNNKDEVEVEALRKNLSTMKVVARAKVTENRVYSAAYHPEPSKDLIFFGDKHGQLGIWDARAPPDEVADEDEHVSAVGEREGGKYWRLQQHWPATSKSSISSIKFDPIDSHSVFTTSYDCTIRRLSLVSSISSQIFSSDDTLITSIDLPPSGHEVWISDALGAITHYDLREGEKCARRYELSEQKIGSVSVNPSSPHLLVTASNNRLLRLWDTRRLQTLTPDTPAPMTPLPSSPMRASSTAQSLGPFEYNYETVQGFIDSSQGRGLMRAEFQHGKSASSAYWDPRGRSIVSTSYDDSVNLWELDAARYDSSPLFPTFKPFSRIKHNCQTGKWLTILRAMWNPNPDVYPHFTIGNMQHSLDIFSCKGDLIARLSDHKRITAVQAVTCSHPNIVERCATGNASGRCVLWAPSDV
ncbi:WD40-repeat-containing domain protein [Scleroderma yunnanense]